MSAHSDRRTDGDAARKTKAGSACGERAVPTQSKALAICNMHRATCRMQHAACNMQQTTSHENATRSVTWSFSVRNDNVLSLKTGTGSSAISGSLPPYTALTTPTKSRRWLPVVQCGLRTMHASSFVRDTYDARHHRCARRRKATARGARVPILYSVTQSGWA